MTTTTNFGLKKPEGNEYVSIDIINENMDSIDAELKNQSDHASNKSNPHGVTKAQVGLGNVPNVATNDQTPTYSDTSTLSTLASGEKLSVAFPKIKLAITNLINHLANKSNPHGVTASQVGLGSVPNKATNDQTPTYTQASTLATLTSGEKLSVSMGKIMKAITDLISHLGNTSNPHGVTAAQIGAALAGNVVSTIVNDASKIASMAALYAVNEAVTQLNSDYKDVINGVNASSGDITIKAKDISSFTVNPTKPTDDYFLMDAYISTTNWAGVISQGIILDHVNNSVSVTVFNTLDTDVVTNINIVAIYRKCR